MTASGPRAPVMRTSGAGGQGAAAHSLTGDRLPRCAVGWGSGGGQGRFLSEDSNRIGHKGPCPTVRSNLNASAVGLQR